MRWFSVLIVLFLGCDMGYYYVKKQAQPANSLLFGYIDSTYSKRGKVERHIVGDMVIVRPKPYLEVQSKFKIKESDSQYHNYFVLSDLVPGDYFFYKIKMDEHAKYSHVEKTRYIFQGYNLSIVATRISWNLSRFVLQNPKNVDTKQNLINIKPHSFMYLGRLKFVPVKRYEEYLKKYLHFTGDIEQSKKAIVYKTHNFLNDQDLYLVRIDDAAIIGETNAYKVERHEIVKIMKLIRGNKFWMKLAKARLDLIDQVLAKK